MGYHSKPSWLKLSLALKILDKNHTIHLPTILLYKAIILSGILPLINTNPYWSFGIMFMALIFWGYDKWLEISVIKHIEKNRISIKQLIEPELKKIDKEYTEKTEKILEQVNQTTLKLTDLTNRINQIQSRTVMTPSGGPGIGTYK